MVRGTRRQTSQQSATSDDDVVDAAVAGVAAAWSYNIITPWAADGRRPLRNLVVVVVVTVSTGGTVVERWSVHT